MIYQQLLEYLVKVRMTTLITFRYLGCIKLDIINQYLQSAKPTHFTVRWFTSEYTWLCNYTTMEENLGIGIIIGSKYEIIFTY